MTPGGRELRDPGYRADVLAQAEVWFAEQGLPNFVESATGGVFRQVVPVLRWGFARSRKEFLSLFSLVMRALPMLLLFITFLFINTEVWQVASSLSRPVLWTAILLFGGVATAFLLVRLPDEIDRVGTEVTKPGALLVALTDTPLDEVAEELQPHVHADSLPWRARANLIANLVVLQALQVLSLSLAVLAFFLVFGTVAIQPEIIESWVGHPPTELPSRLGAALPFSNELWQVSLFLAGFAGLYFTVYAVVDENYRKQFFTGVAAELERAIAMRVAYAAIREGAPFQVQLLAGPGQPLVYPGGPLDTDLGRLVVDADEAGFANMSRLVSQAASGEQRFDKDGEGLWGAHSTSGELVGVMGLTQQSGDNTEHTLRVRRAYVLSNRRRTGIGGALWAAVLASAATSGQQQLVLRTDTSEASKFYAALGFRRVAPAGQPITHVLDLATGDSGSVQRTDSLGVRRRTAAD